MSSRIIRVPCSVPQEWCGKARPTGTRRSVHGSAHGYLSDQGNLEAKLAPRRRLVSPAIRKGIPAFCRESAKGAKRRNRINTKTQRHKDLTKESWRQGCCRPSLPASPRPLWSLRDLCVFVFVRFSRFRSF